MKPGYQEKYESGNTTRNAVSVGFLVVTPCGLQP
jgi:hypothetical protein